MEPDVIRFGSVLEPLVRLIEETPRDRCVGKLADQVRRGVSYRGLLAATFLAGIRTFGSHHSVYLVHSAHQVSLDLPEGERLLPLFWAVDHLKWQRERVPPKAVRALTGPLPSAERAAGELDEALRQSDLERAERAAAALVRSVGPRQAFEPLWRHGCRDLSLIGHRAISVSSCRRVMDTIGWQHAEPVMRFVLQDLHTRNGAPDRYYRPNGERAVRVLERLPHGWAAGGPDEGATLELFAMVRQGKSDEACDLAVKLLECGVGAQALWDALHVAAAELLMLHPSPSGMAGRPLHLNTALSALHFAFDEVANPEVRLLNLLQATAWAGDFTRVHLGQERLKHSRPVELEGALAVATVHELFARLPARMYKNDVDGGFFLVDRAARTDVGRSVFALLKQDPSAQSAFMRTAITRLCEKAVTEAHEFKLPAALFEDLASVSPEWRPRLLAASAHWLHGKQSPDAPLLQKARAALRIGRGG